MRRRLGTGPVIENLLITRAFSMCVRRTIERSVAEKKQGEQPGQRKQAVVNALQRFNFLMTQRATFDNDCKAEREKKYHTDKNYDAIELERRIAAAGDDEGQRAHQK